VYVTCVCDMVMGRCHIELARDSEGLCQRPIDGNGRRLTIHRS